MKKQLLYSILKGIFPLLIYYTISKLTGPKGGFMYYPTYKEIIGMAFFYSIGLIVFDLIIQTILFYLVIRRIRPNIVSNFVQGFLLNLPLCILWIYGFGEMKDPSWIIALISFLISSIIAGFIYLGLNKIDFNKITSIS